MAAYGWGQNHSVKAGLFGEPERFSFFQAVRLLEIFTGRSTSVGEGVEPDQEAIRFASRVGLDFPPADIDSLEPSQGGEPPTLRVNVLGLAGALGPLPRAYTEMLMRRERSQDPAFREFLDLFNHRLVSLLYRARKKSFPAMELGPPSEGRSAACLFSFIGLGTPRLRNRLGVEDRSLLPFAGILTGARRTQVGLERVLSGTLGLEVAVRAFEGAWWDLADDQLTRLGDPGAGRLGQGAVLGRRVWDQQAGFQLEVGPVSQRRLYGLLPNGKEFGTLRALTHFYAGDEMDFSMRLLVDKKEIPPLQLGSAGDTRLGWSARLGGDQGGEPRLGGAGGSRLGWTSWLKYRPLPGEDGNDPDVPPFDDQLCLRSPREL